MSDELRVREPCEHGFYLMHPIDGMPGSAGPTISCPGGREIVLRQVEFVDFVALRSDQSVWVEVDDE